MAASESVRRGVSIVGEYGLGIVRLGVHPHGHDDHQPIEHRGVESVGDVCSHSGGNSGLCCTPREGAMTVVGNRRLVYEQRRRLHRHIRSPDREEWDVAGCWLCKSSCERGTNRTTAQAQHRVDVGGVGTFTGESFTDLDGLIRPSARESAQRISASHRESFAGRRP